MRCMQVNLRRINFLTSLYPLIEQYLFFCNSLVVYKNISPFRDGKAIEMSFDHKPEDAPERERIENAGGRVTPDGRVNGGLNLSRAIGDHAYKTNKSLPLQGML